jgi:hypothetical protein
MLITNESLIIIITVLAAAAVGLCYLPVVQDVSAFVIKQRQKTNPTKQLEQKILKLHQGILNKIEKRTEANFGTALKDLEKTLTDQSTALSDRQAETLIKLADDVSRNAQKNQQEIQTATDKYLGETNIALQGLVGKAAQKIDEGLTQQLDTTRTELENYKKEQIKKIDNEIATIVEKTIYRVLGKGLSPKEHLDIIYEALAEAKAEGFFGKYEQ